jgi:hypothetical protein
MMTWLLIVIVLVLSVGVLFGILSEGARARDRAR